MMERREEQTEEKGFTVSDRRFTSKTTAKEERQRQESPLSAERGKSPPTPAVDFSTFLLSLSSAAMIYFGEIADPASGQKTKNLDLAKHHIDLIAMLEEKTRGNLTPEEANLLRALLYDLRMRYVQETKR